MIEYYKDFSLDPIVYFSKNGKIFIEKWKPVKDFEGIYEVSNLGRIKSFLRNGNLRDNGGYNYIIKKQRITSRGYLSCNFRKKNFNKDFRVHRVVAIAFIPNPENKPEVNHKGRKPNKLDNRCWRIEWNTSSENKKHARKNGLVENVKGSAHPNSKLTEKQVLEIREIDRKMTLPEIAKIYNVSKATISLILLRKLWGHI